MGGADYGGLRPEECAGGIGPALLIRPRNHEDGVGRKAMVEQKGTRELDVLPRVRRLGLNEDGILGNSEHEGVPSEVELHDRPIRAGRAALNNSYVIHTVSPYCRRREMARLAVEPALAPGWGLSDRNRGVAGVTACVGVPANLPSQAASSSQGRSAGSPEGTGQKPHWPGSRSCLQRSFMTRRTLRNQ